jgi:uncharacterized protein (TIGR02147 family)
LETHLWLREYLTKKKETTPGFSLRTLAKRLSISHSFLSRMLNGKKPIPLVLLPRFQLALDIENEVFERIRKSFEGAQDSPVHVPTKTVVNSAIEDWELTGKKILKILRNWFYVAILDLTLLKDFDGSTDMICRRLGISTTAAEVAIRELLALGFLKTAIDGRLLKSGRKLHFGSAVSRKEIRQFHKLYLKKSEEQLDTATKPEDFARRLISGITLTVPQNRVSYAKTRIWEFMHELSNELTSEEGDDVYQLGVQFFPLTKTND